MAKSNDNAENTAAVTQETAQDAQQGAVGTNTQAAPLSAQYAKRDAPTGAKKADGTVYSADDLVNAARTRFKVPPEVVKAALKLAGKDKATLPEAQAVVKEFMERKVTR